MQISKNKIIIKADHAEIELFSTKHGVKNTIIDLEDVDKCKNYRWFFVLDGNTFYSYAHKGSTTIKLHRLIMDAPTKIVVDHINRDGLDNRKINLRLCTQKENIRNSKLYKNNSSGYKGISFIRNKWRSRIFIEGKDKHLGLFDTLEEAITARENYIMELSIIKEN